MSDLLKQYLLDNFKKKETLLIQNEALLPLLRKHSPPKKEVRAHAPPPPKPFPPKEKPAPQPPHIEKPAPFALDKPKPKETAPSLLSSIYKKAAPGLLIHEAPPDDTLVKKRNLAPKDKSVLPQVPIFVSSSDETSLLFLTNLAHAIDNVLAPSKLYLIDEVEKENRWANIFDSKELKLILIPETLLFKSPNLITYYSKSHTKLLGELKEIPTLVLHDPAAYLKNPELKAPLWKLLVNILKRG